MCQQPVIRPGTDFNTVKVSAQERCGTRGALSATPIFRVSRWMAGDVITSAASCLRHGRIHAGCVLPGRTEFYGSDVVGGSLGYRCWRAADNRLYDTDSGSIGGSGRSWISVFTPPTARAEFVEL